jgi:hypothetical protein
MQMAAYLIQVVPWSDKSFAKQVSRNEFLLYLIQLELSEYVGDWSSGLGIGRS